MVIIASKLFTDFDPYPLPMMLANVARVKAKPFPAALVFAWIAFYFDANNKRHTCRRPTVHVLFHSKGMFDSVSFSDLVARKETVIFFDTLYV